MREYHILSTLLMTALVGTPRFNMGDDARSLMLQVVDVVEQWARLVYSWSKISWLLLPTLYTPAKTAQSICT